MKLTGKPWKYRELAPITFEKVMGQVCTKHPKYIIGKGPQKG
jgi:hypothetical protein